MSEPQPTTGRRWPIGAELLSTGGVHFRVWAPRRQRVDVVVLDAQGANTSVTALQPENDGYFSGLVRDATANALYRFRLDDADSFPDPASRCQPDGPHG